MDSNSSKNNAGRLSEPGRVHSRALRLRSGSAAAEYGLSSAAAPATHQPEKEIRLVSEAQGGMDRSCHQEVFTVGEGEHLDITFIVLPGTSAEIPVTVDITGPGAEVELKGIYLSSGTDNVTFDITMNHRVGGSISRQLFNGLATDKAKCAFNGKIIVAQDAQKTEAYQENHNIVLSDDATVDTKPQLEIYADDVKCSHGATVGKLNEDEQFYMRSRGIPEDEAKVLQMISFVAPVLAGIEDEDLTARIENAIRSL